MYIHGLPPRWCPAAPFPSCLSVPVHLPNHSTWNLHQLFCSLMHMHMHAASPCTAPAARFVANHIIADRALKAAALDRGTTLKSVLGQEVKVGDT